MGEGRWRQGGQQIIAVVPAKKEKRVEWRCKDAGFRMVVKPRGLADGLVKRKEGERAQGRHLTGLDWGHGAILRDGSMWACSRGNLPLRHATPGLRYV